MSEHLTEMTNEPWRPTVEETEELMAQLRGLRDWLRLRARRLTSKRDQTSGGELPLALGLTARLTDTQETLTDLGELIGWMERLERDSRAKAKRPWTTEEILAREG